MQSSFVALFAASLVAGASAVVTPVGNPSGNNITSPALHDIATAGKPWTIRWIPTTPASDLITFVLCKGPPTNCQTLPKPIVEHVKNTGSYAWTPSTSLEPTEGDTGYGIQLIVESSGQNQYTPQFGIKNPSYGSSSGSGTSSSTSHAAASPAAASHASSATQTVTVSTTSSLTGGSDPTGSGGVPSGSLVTPNPTPSVPSTLGTQSTTGTLSTTVFPGAAAPTMGPRVLVGLVGMGLGALVL